MSARAKRSINKSFVSAGIMNSSSPMGVEDEQPKVEDVVEVNNDVPDHLDENGKPIYKKIFQNRKKASVRAKEKKNRINRTMRKMVVPKNALMALHEVKGVSMSEFVIEVNTTGGHVATVTINDNIYKGYGPSKVAAKNNACEKALRDIVITKMRQKPRSGKKAGDAEDAMDVSGDEDDEDDVPMLNLASFAIYKLFGEWESEGFTIPEMHPSKAADNEETPKNSSSPKESKLPKPRAELPTNWEELNPALLFSQMRPGHVFTDLNSIGMPPSIIHSVSVTVDDTEYVAYGRTKKLARRNCSVIVLNTLFNTNFEQTEPFECPLEDK